MEAEVCEKLFNKSVVNLMVTYWTSLGTLWWSLWVSEFAKNRTQKWDQHQNQVPAHLRGPDFRKF